MATGVRLPQYAMHRQHSTSSCDARSESTEASQASKRHPTHAEGWSGVRPHLAEVGRAQLAAVADPGGVREVRVDY